MDIEEYEPSRQDIREALNLRLKYMCPALTPRTEWCELGDNPCFYSLGDSCDYYEEFLREVANEEEE